jgi:hypothetical protein
LLRPDLNRNSQTVAFDRDSDKYPINGAGFVNFLKGQYPDAALDNQNSATSVGHEGGAYRSIQGEAGHEKRESQADCKPLPPSFTETHEIKERNRAKTNERSLRRSLLDNNLLMRSFDFLY